MSEDAHQVDEDEVRRLARLCRLSPAAKDIPRLAREMSDIVAYFEQLGVLNLDGVEPMHHAGAAGSVLREDEPEPGLLRRDALEPAPCKTEAAFLVPPVLGDSE